MNGRGRRLLRAVGFGLLGLLGVLLAVALTQPWWLAPLVGHRLSAASGRSVHFDSLWFGLSGSAFEPTLHAHGVRIENAAWADTRHPFADLQQATVVFSWRSVGEHRPVIALLVLRDGEVAFERQADGLRNWRLRNPDYRGPGRVKVLSLQAERATVRFAHRGIDLDLAATARTNQAEPAVGAAGEALPIRIAFKGEWRKLAFSADVETGAVLTFLETGRTFPLRGRLESGGARLDVDGRAGDVVREPSIDAQVALAGTSLAPFHAFVGRRRDEAPKAMRVEGHLNAGDHAYRLSVLKARIGTTDLAGDAGFEHGEQRNAFKANLSSDSTDLADLMWLAGKGADARSEAAGSATSAATPTLSSAPFDLAGARGLDADLRYEARRLHAARIPLLHSLKAHAVLAAGRLAVSDVDVGVAQGHVSGHAEIDLREPTLKAETDLALRGLRLEALWREQPHDKRVTGTLQGRVQLKSVGGSAAALLANTAGTLSASLAGGTLSSLLDAEMGLQGGKILRSMLGGAEPIPIRCASAAIDMRAGVGRIRTLTLDTERTRTTATGSFNLVDRSFDLVLTPEAKQGGLFVIDRSIRIGGAAGQPFERRLVERAPVAAGQGCAG